MKLQTILLTLLFVIMPAFAMNVSGANYTVNSSMGSTQGNEPTSAMFMDTQFITAPTHTANGNSTSYCAHVGFFSMLGGSCPSAAPTPPTPPTPAATGGHGVSNMNHGFYYILLIILPVLAFLLWKKKENDEDDT